MYPGSRDFIYKAWLEIKFSPFFPPILGAVFLGDFSGFDQKCTRNPRFRHFLLEMCLFPPFHTYFWAKMLETREMLIMLIMVSEKSC